MKIPYIVCEAGINFLHDPWQDREGIRCNISKLITAAAECGADAIKFQCYSVEDLKDNTEDIPLFDMLEKAQLNGDEWRSIKDVAGENNIDWFASVFSEKCLDYILDFNPCRWKTAAPDLVRGAKWAEDVDLEWWASYDGRFGEFDSEYRIDTANKAEIILACRSDYPATVDDYEIMALEHGDDEFAGCSDHTLGFEFVGYMGYRFTIFEKHFTLDKTADGPDHWISLDPKEMKRYVEIIHTAHGDKTIERERLKGYQNRWK